MIYNINPNLYRYKYKYYIYNHITPLNKNYKDNVYIFIYINNLINKSLKNYLYKYYNIFKYLNTININIYIGIYKINYNFKLNKINYLKTILSDFFYNKIKLSIYIYYNPFLFFKFFSYYIIKYLDNYNYYKINIKNIIKILYLQYIYIDKQIKGLKLKIKGKLDNSNRSKNIYFILGNISNTKINNNINYIKFNYKTNKGIIGIKLWIIK